MKKQAFLPLVTYPDVNADAIAGNAVAVVAYLKADLHVTTLNARKPEAKKALSQRVVKLVTEAEALSRGRGEHLLARVREAAARKEVKLTTGGSSASVALLGKSAAARRATSILFSLVGRREIQPQGPWPKALSSDRAGRSLPDRAVVDTIDHIAIAWDGSRVAARALADATPLLEQASQISVLTVVDEKSLKQRDIAEHLADGLRKRGVAAESFSITVKGRPIGASLQEHAIERGARLLVMGGYGHSRVRDFVLGGATKDVLRDLQLPVLVSH